MVQAREEPITTMGSREIRLCARHGMVDERIQGWSEASDGVDHSS